MQELQNSQYRLRKTIGFLGIALPFIIFFVNQKLLSSISHYYYTSASIFFIGILFTFGLVLITYKGYSYNKGKNEKISDDLITTLAGVSILVTVLIPTECTGSGHTLLFCDNGYLFGHSNSVKGTIHLMSAAIFLFALGWMCIKQFTKSENPGSKRKNSVYRICGYIVWSCIAILMLIFSFEKMLSIDFNVYINGYTFMLESVAVWAFSIAWLIKGKINKDWNGLIVKPIKSLYNR